MRDRRETVNVAHEDTKGESQYRDPKDFSSVTLIAHFNPKLHMFFIIIELHTVSQGD